MVSSIYSSSYSIQVHINATYSHRKLTIIGMLSETPLNCLCSFTAEQIKKILLLSVPRVLFVFHLKSFQLTWGHKLVILVPQTHRITMKLLAIGLHLGLPGPTECTQYLSFKQVDNKKIFTNILSEITIQKQPEGKQKYSTKPEGNSRNKTENGNIFWKVLVNLPWNM